MPPAKPPPQRPARQRSLRLSDTVGKAISILDALGHEPYDLTTSEVAAAVGLDRTTVYRLLETLAERRLVTRDPQTRRYRLGLRALDYANAVRDRLEVRHVALSHLVDLQHELDLQPNLCRCTLVALLDDLEVVLVETLGAAAPQTDLTRRARIPAHISATGRCLLAYLEPAELNARLDRMFANANANACAAPTETAQRRKRLIQELAAIRQRGYALSDRQVGSNTRALAAPVRARSGAPLAAVGIVVDPAKMSLAELVERYAGRMVSIAERISLALRYRG